MNGTIANAVVVNGKSNATEEDENNADGEKCPAWNKEKNVVMSFILLGSIYNLPKPPLWLLLLEEDRLSLFAGTNESNAALSKISRLQMSADRQ